MADLPTNSGGKKRLLIADDDPDIRAVLRESLEPDWNVLGEAGNGFEAVRATERLRPDVVLLDVSMPIMNGFAAAKRIKQIMPDVLIIFVSQHSDAAYLEEAFRLGASAYVLKRAAMTDLGLALESAMAGRTFCSLIERRAGTPG
ncbi:MAG: response regulator transcription factor [Acidobacteriaceae bacterium]|nr:response regulator transcription factor [Acidobacteriaceae bacterium]